MQEVRTHLPTDRVVVVHDLGCGTGSMARWLAAQLNGPQRWVMVDRDAELLAVAETNPPEHAADGSPVTIETRRRDITRLAPHELGGAALITASALLDMMTGGSSTGSWPPTQVRAARPWSCSASRARWAGAAPTPSTTGSVRRSTPTSAAPSTARGCSALTR